MSIKLYEVSCRGMKYDTGGGIVYGKAFVLAENPSDAYKKMRKTLDEQSIGSSKDLELESVKLLAEDSLYPDCEIRLYI